MRTSLFTLLLATLMSSPLAAQLHLWEHSYGADTLGESIATTLSLPGGGFMGFGHSCNDLTGSEHRGSLYWITTDTLGGLLMERRGPQHFRTIPYDVAPHPAGGYTIVGSGAETPTDASKIYVARVLDEGIAEQFLGSGFEISHATALGAGGFIVSGTDAGQIVLARLSPDGALVWERRYHLGIQNLVGAAGETGDGGFVVTGTVSNPPSTQTHAFLLIVAANGDSVWSRLVGSGVADEGTAVVQRMDGSFLVAVHSRQDYLSQAGKVELVGTDRFGNVVSSFIVGDDAYANVTRFVPASSGGYLGVGASGISVDATKFWLVRIRENGSPLWQMTVGRSGLGYLGRAVLPVSDNAYLLSGSVRGDAVMAFVTEAPSGVDGEPLQPKRLDLK